jgi:hypothetical protein
VKLDGYSPHPIPNIPFQINILRIITRIQRHFPLFALLEGKENTVLFFAREMENTTSRTMRNLEKAASSTVAGTHVDLEASIRSASVADVDMLHRADELVYDDFDFLTTMDVNKLAGQGWKKKKKKGLKNETHSTFADTTLSSVINLEDALARFDLDRDGRLNEKEQAALYRT